MKTCKYCLKELDEALFTKRGEICSFCKEERKTVLHDMPCKKCGEMYQVPLKTRSLTCDECKAKAKTQHYLENLLTECHDCHQKLNRTHFDKNKQVCKECSKKREEVESKIGLKICERCKQEKRMPDEIYYGSHKCYECEKQIEEEKKNQQLWPRPCKECGIVYQVLKYKTWFICDKCKKEKQEKYLHDITHKFCKKCGEEFIKDHSRRDCYCDKCKNESKEGRIKRKEEYKTTCVKCDRTFKRSENFNLKKFICDECAEAINCEKYFNKTYRHCKECNEYKLIGEEITYKAFYCKICDKKRRRARVVVKKKTSWLRKCSEPDCGKIVITTNPRTTIICCSDCREKKRLLKREKKLKEINRVKQDFCQICKKHTLNDEIRDRNIVCLNCRPLMKQFIASCFKDGKYFKVCVQCEEEYEVPKHRFWSAIRCPDCIHKRVLIGNRHRFGYQGKCSDGHRFQSLNEMDFDEWLTFKNIEHIAHPRLRPTYRCSDYYLPKFDKYVEIDGLDRKDDVDWYGKLTVYEKLNIKPLIVTPVSKHFIESRDVCFGEFDLKVLPLLELQVDIP
jgi:hypothetical protein